MTTEPTLNASICFVDTETTGLHSERQAWEIAIIRRDPVTDAHHTGNQLLHLFVDVDLSHAEPAGLRVGRFYERHPRGRWLAGRKAGRFPDVSSTVLTDAGEPAEVVSQATAAQIVAHWTHGAHLVGAVPNFDAEVFSTLLRQHGLTPAWHYHLIDVETLAVGWLHGRYAERPGAGLSGAASELPWSSDDLSKACGVEPPTDDDRHTAMGDAEWCMRWYDAITGSAA